MEGMSEESKGGRKREGEGGIIEGRREAGRGRKEGKERRKGVSEDGMLEGRKERSKQLN